MKYSLGNQHKRALSHSMCKVLSILASSEQYRATHYATTVSCMLKSTKTSTMISMKSLNYWTTMYVVSEKTRSEQKLSYLRLKTGTASA